MTEREGNTNAQRVDEREVRSGRSPGYTPLEENRGTSWISVVLGWLAALGVGLILSGIGGRQLRHRRTPGIDRRRGHRPDRAPDHAAPGLPDGWLRRRSHGCPLGPQARAPGAALGPGGDGGAGDHRRTPGSQLHRPALRHHAAPGRAAERPAGGPAAGLGHDPERLGPPCVALPLYRRGHRRPMGARTGTRRP
jgi:hypothetical protein